MLTPEQHKRVEEGFGLILSALGLEPLSAIAKQQEAMLEDIRPEDRPAFMAEVQQRMSENIAAAVQLAVQEYQRAFAAIKAKKDAEVPEA
jgi:hypothetical protein